MQRHHQQNCYPSSPQQRLPAQAKDACRFDAPYRQLPPQQQLPRHFPIACYDSNNNYRFPRHLPLIPPTSNCAINPYCHPLHDFYPASPQQRRRQEFHNDNNNVSRPHRLVEPAICRPRRQQQQHGAVVHPGSPQAYFLRFPLSNELLYPNHHPPVVYRPIPAAGYPPTSDETAVPVNKETYKQAPIDNKPSCPMCDENPRGNSLSSAVIQIQEPNQQPPLSPKFAKQPSATLSGVSTTASLGSASDQHRADCLPKFKGLPCLAKVVPPIIVDLPILATPFVPYHEQRSYNNPVGAGVDEFAPSQHSSSSTIKLNSHATRTSDQANERSGNTTHQEGPYMGGVVKRKISETYKKRGDGTWIGLGMRETTEIRENGKTNETPNCGVSARSTEGLTHEPNREFARCPNQIDHGPKRVESTLHCLATSSAVEGSLISALWNLKQRAVNLMHSKFSSPASSEKKEKRVDSAVENTKAKTQGHVDDESDIDTRKCETARQRRTTRANTKRPPKSTDVTISPILNKDNASLLISTSVTKNLFDRSPELFLSSTSSSSVSFAAPFENVTPPPKLPPLKLDAIGKKSVKRQKKKLGECKTARPTFQEREISNDAVESGEPIDKNSNEKSAFRLKFTNRYGADETALDEEMFLGSISYRDCPGKYGKHIIQILDPRNPSWLLKRKGEEKRALPEETEYYDDEREENRNADMRCIETCRKDYQSPSLSVEDKRLNQYKNWLIRTHRLPRNLFLNFDEVQFVKTIVEDRNDDSTRIWGRYDDARQPRCRVLMEEINNGTFCTVFKAKYRGKEVAVKCPLKHQIESDPEMTNVRAVKELRLLSRASNHLNILKLYGGLIVSKQEIYVVTEFVPGGDLYTKLYHDTNDGSHSNSSVRSGILPAQRLKIMLQLSSALSFLHSLEPKIVHKDLKSNNILVDEGFDIRLCDFGDAEEIRAGEGIKYYTAVTWQYASPEIILSKDPSHPERHCNESVDIWSLGCILLELCYRPTPFWHLLERIDPIHHHVALQNYLHKILGGSNVGSAHHQLHVHHQYYHHPFYRRFKEGQFFRSRLPHCLSVLIDWCLNFDSSSRPTAKQVYVYILQFRSNLLKELTELDEHRQRKDKKKRFL